MKARSRLTCLAPLLGDVARWLAVALAAVAGGAALGYLYVLRRPLPQTRGELCPGGLDLDVEVIRDRWGVPRVYVQSFHDFYAQGYVHAQDRLWQMELQRRVASGTLAEVVGELGLATDRFYRLGAEGAAAVEPSYPEGHPITATPGVDHFGADGFVPAQFQEAQRFLGAVRAGAASNAWAGDGVKSATGLPILDMTSLWRRGEYHPLPFSRRAVLGAAADRLVLRAGQTTSDLTRTWDSSELRPTRTEPRSRWRRSPESWRPIGTSSPGPVCATCAYTAYCPTVAEQPKPAPLR